ncbi:hypothetical protein D3C72_1629810 [compost metagenome]
MPQDADDVLVDQLLGDLHADARVGLVITRHQHELGGLAVNLDALLVGFFQGQVQAVLHVLAIVRLRTGKRRGKAEFDVRGLSGGGHARGGDGGGGKLQSGVQLHGVSSGMSDLRSCYT